MKKDAILDVPANGAGKHHFLEVAALFHQVLGGIAMLNSRHALLDNRAVIENFRDVMRGGADELDSAIIGLLVRLRADERRQKRVVNVDHLLRIVADEIGESTCM